MNLVGLPNVALRIGADLVADHYIAVRRVSTAVGFKIHLTGSGNGSGDAVAGEDLVYGGIDNNQWAVAAAGSTGRSAGISLEQDAAMACGVAVGNDLAVMIDGDAVIVVIVGVSGNDADAA